SVFVFRTGQVNEFDRKVAEIKFWVRTLLLPDGAAILNGWQPGGKSSENLPLRIDFLFHR
ncbi:MAG TPA: hypothetical protein V6D02_11265, partial [Candidatus Obscuribacterales bacterium]